MQDKNKRNLLADNDAAADIFAMGRTRLATVGVEVNCASAGGSYWPGQDSFCKHNLFNINFALTWDEEKNPQTCVV